jgi:type I restriction enzyme M protein
VFIDASNDFEKEKTQHKLKPEHLAKIINTYKARQSVDKYCAVVDLAQVQANEYNLNIPRYVDTFEAEAVLDLAAIAVQIQQIEAAEVGTRAGIAAF